MNKYREENILPDPTSGQEAFDQIRDYILGKDWYVVDSMCTDQVNTIAVEEIKDKWNRATSRELRDKWNKMIDKLKL